MSAVGQPGPEGLGVGASALREAFPLGSRRPLLLRWGRAALSAVSARPRGAFAPQASSRRSSPPALAVATSESSWHRRARRERQQARALLAVDRARRTLASHHGGGGCNGVTLPAMPVDQPALPPWTCAVCGVHDNWGHRTRCRNCNAYPPPSHRALDKGGQAGGKPNSYKGKGKGSGNRGTPQGKGSAAGGATLDGLGSFAHRQLQLARRANSAQQAQTAFKSSLKELQDARRRNDGLQEQNRRLQRELDEAKASVANHHGDTDEGMEDGPEELGDEDRKGRMDKLRNSLPYLEETFGAESDIFINATAELEHHQRTLRGAKPFKTHRTILERKVEKLRKLQGRDKNRLTELQEAAEEISSKITSTSAAIAERDKELEAAEAELKELVLKAVGEEAAQPPPAVDPAQSWDNVVGAVAQLVRVPGVPSEFTCQLEGMFNQLRTMVTALQSHATANGVPHGVEHDSARPGNLSDETPQLGAAQAAQLLEQQSAARRQRLQAVQTQHINRFVAHQRSELASRPAGTGTTTDDGTRPPTLAPVSENGGSAEDEQAPRETAGSSSSSAHHTSAVPPTAAPATAPAAAAAAATLQAAPAVAEASAPNATIDRDTCDDDHMQVSGGETEGESFTDQEDQQVEAIGAKLSTEQKGKLRAVLQVRKARLARRTARHKKPEEEEGPVPRDCKRR